METDTLLLEIGTEELPPKSLKRLMQEMESGLAKELSQAGFSFESTDCFATPRRLAVRIFTLTESQADQSVEKRGPAIKAAYDEEGNPTKALLGFAKSCQVSDLESLDRMSTEKGEWVVFRSVKKGEMLTDKIQLLIESTLAALSIERNMRWGSSRTRAS